MSELISGCQVPKSSIPAIWDLRTKIKPGFGYFQIVGSGILHIVMHGNPDEGSLLKVLEPLLSRLSHSSWTALDVNVMWNSKRPVWFQASIEMLRI